jgi:hypothetical protein
MAKTKTAPASQATRNPARLAADIQKLLAWYTSIGGADGLAQAQAEIHTQNAALEARFAARVIH